MRFARDYGPTEGNCFVLMPFGVKKLSNGTEFDWDAHWEKVIAPAIKDAMMSPIRADDIYGATPLMERIWRGIQEAEVVVADLTTRNPNVLYELGLSHVIGKRIVLLTMDPADVPGDLAQFVQIRYSIDGIGLLTLTRELNKNLQAARREPSAEAALFPLPGVGMERVSATVIAVANEFVTVRATDGRLGFLHAEDVSWIRRSLDLTRMFTPNQQVDGAFVVGAKGERKYSLTATRENPWPRLSSEFPLEGRFIGTVVNVRSGIGAFVRIRHGIDGLIPQSFLPANAGISRGVEVEAYPVKIDSATREVELRLGRVVSAPTRAYNPGQRFDGHVKRISPRRDYALVSLPDGVSAMLHIRKMSEDFKRRLDRDEVEIGTGVAVEVVDADATGRVEVRDVPNA